MHIEIILVSLLLSLSVSALCSQAITGANNTYSRSYSLHTEILNARTREGSPCERFHSQATNDSSKLRSKKILSIAKLMFTKLLVFIQYFFVIFFNFTFYVKAKKNPHFQHKPSIQFKHNGLVRFFYIKSNSVCGFMSREFSQTMENF